MLYKFPSRTSTEPDAVTCFSVVGNILYAGLQYGQQIRVGSYPTEEEALAASDYYTDEINERKTPKAAIQPERKPEKHQCYWCDEETQCKDFVQAMTGRVFCSLGCWNDHLRSEGFNP